ncbi:hypothetical protein ANANG_G00099110 [Anguilla anguilla]|uniref:Uncharacterized protein n=1 Tax=Anguilla anguilla TaxID=7936 RepID=A0A9D3S0Y4_ANGAN|nr:hypothetical protein ANANG_G00099110 [Anguilla anguilla]
MGVSSGVCSQKSDSEEPGSNFEPCRETVKVERAPFVVRGRHHAGIEQGIIANCEIEPNRLQWLTLTAVAYLRFGRRRITKHVPYNKRKYHSTFRYSLSHLKRGRKKIKAGSGGVKRIFSLEATHKKLRKLLK